MSINDNFIHKDRKLESPCRGTTRSIDNMGIQDMELLQ